MHELRDEDIIEQVLRGNHKAYAILVERYQHFAFTLALRIMQHTEDAEEATQDAFVKAYNKLSDYSGESKFSTWLYTITRNTCLSRLRAKKTEITTYKEVTDTEVGSTNNIEASLNLKNKQQIVNDVIKQLNEEEASIITLYYISEQSIDEICSIMGITNSNAKVKLYRARKHLKALLDKHYAAEMGAYKSNE